MYKLLTHNDLDGVSCGILAKIAFGRKVDVRYNSIGAIDREVGRFLEKEGKSRFLFITDMSVNEEIEKELESFYQQGGKVQLIDHHQTAEHLNQYPWGIVKIENETGHLHSATSLFYSYLVENQWLTPSKTIEEYVELVRQYDTWEWEANGNEDAQHLNALFYLMTIDEFEDKMMDRLTTSEQFHFDSYEIKILNMEDNKMERYIRRKRRELVQTKIDEHYAGVVYAESYHSELGNELGKEYPHLDYIAILNIGAKRIGFRTIHDSVDVSVVAKGYGGGGHAKASGCTLTEEAYEQFVAKTFPLKPLREDARRNRYNIKGTEFGVLYKNRKEELFFVYFQSGKRWVVEKNRTLMEYTFSSFQEAENYIKRKEEVWLVRDDTFVSNLMDLVKEKSKH